MPDQPFHAPMPAAARLRDLLDTLRLSEAESAKLLGISLMTVRGWLASEYVPPDMAFIALDSILASRRLRQVDAVATAYRMATDECAVAAQMCAALSTADVLRGSARRFALLAERFDALANELRLANEQPPSATGAAYGKPQPGPAASQYTPTDL